MDFYEAAEAALPYAIAFAGMAILSGNDFARRFLVDCGMSYRMRRVAGASLCVGALAMLVEITSCHVTSGLIGALLVMATSAWNRGKPKSAFGSAVTALSLAPMVVVP